MPRQPDPFRRLTTLALLGGAAFGPRAWAQPPAYPAAKPIRIVVPAGPGSAPDVLARLVAEKLGRRMQQSFIVDPVPGAAGMLGAAQVARAEPDGYTLMYGFNQLVTINPYLYEKMPYDAAAGFTPVTLVARGGMVLIASPSLEASDLQGLITLAKRKPGSLVYASTGSGSVANVAMELLKQSTGIDMLHVPYKTGSASTTDLISGRVDVKLEPPASAVPLAKSGKVKALAVTTARRMAVLPEVGTFADALPGFDYMGWNGFMAPPRTPADIVQRLNKEVRAVLEMPDVRQRFADFGVEPAATTPAEMADMIQREAAQWARVIRQAGIKPD